MICNHFGKKYDEFEECDDCCDHPSICRSFQVMSEKLESVIKETDKINKKIKEICDHLNIK